MKIVCFLSVCLFLSELLGQSVVADQKDEEWIDPMDMINFDPSSNKMKHDTVSTTTTTTNPLHDSVNDSGSQKVKDKGTTVMSECTAGGACSVLFKQFIRRLLYHVNGKVSDELTTLNMRFTISLGEMETLQKFVDDKSDKDIHNAHTVIDNMIKHVSQHHPGEQSSRILWLEDLIGIRVQFALPLLLVVCLVFASGLLLLKLEFSWWRVSVQLIFLLFCISVIWTWYEMYKREQAKMHHAMMKDMPKGCQNTDPNAGILSTLKAIYSSMFTFETEACVAYYEHLITDPMWKVAPTEALAVTFVRFFLAPLRHLAKGIREFTTTLLIDLPLHMWPVVGAFIGVFLFLVLFMGFGYRVRLPFIAVEPMEQKGLQYSADIEHYIKEQGRELAAIKEVLMQNRKAELVHQKTHSALPSALAALPSPVKGNGPERQTTPTGTICSEYEGGEGDNSKINPDTVGTMRSSCL